MVVMTPTRGAMQVEHARSRTAIYPPNQAMLNMARHDASASRLEMQRLNGAGLGMVDVPDWAWWAAGGVALGAVAGYFLWKRKR